MAKENAYRETFPLNKTYKVSLFFFTTVFCYFLCNRSDGNDDAISNPPKLCTIFFPLLKRISLILFLRLSKVSGGKIYLIYIPYKCQGTEVRTHFNI
jgi:hypothetical protein